MVGFRSLLIDQFDLDGGFGTGPKSPTSPCARVRAGHGRPDGDESCEIVEVTLARIETLWDAGSGGFYRYADGSDWSRPATEKTLDDNAAVLRRFSMRPCGLDSDACRERAADLVRWVKQRSLMKQMVDSSTARRPSRASSIARCTPTATRT